MKIAVCVLSQDMLHADFAFAFNEAVVAALGAGYGVGVKNFRSSIVEKGRHDAVCWAKSMEADKVLFLDSDMSFPANTIKDLVKHDKPVIGCDCVRRRPPIERLVKVAPGTLRVGLQQVASLCGGIFMADAAVFAKIGEPYFEVQWDDDKKEFIGEDRNFFAKCQALGIPQFCDFDLSEKVLHIGSYPFGIRNAKS